jgi:hypothetical protein
VRVLCVFDDLLLGSKVLGMLKAAGHDASLASSVSDCDVAVVDVAAFDPASVIVEGVRFLGLYSHVSPGQRDAALAAGFDLVVPRSRFMREGVALVEGLA